MNIHYQGIAYEAEPDQQFFCTCGARLKAQYTQGEHGAQWYIRPCQTCIDNTITHVSEHIDLYV